MRSFDASLLLKVERKTPVTIRFLQITRVRLFRPVLIL
jgi:hypothetical protein